MSQTTSKGTATVTLPADDQILIAREFEAPAHLVWKALTTPELVKRWWAGQRPRGLEPQAAVGPGHDRDAALQVRDVGGAPGHDGLLQGD